MSGTTSFYDRVMGYPCTGTTAGLAALAGYMIIIQMLRFRRVRAYKASDAQDDPSSIYRAVSMLEFPFTVNKALEVALFRTYGVPSISRLLQKTRQFSRCAGKRYDDTDLLLREYSEHDPALDRSTAAIGRVNAIHQLYSKDISNADMLFTISLFITEPISWIDRFEWRKTSLVEKEAIFSHFKVMGKRMGILGVEKWKTWKDAFTFQEAYEGKYLEYADSNKEIAEATMGLFLTIVPGCISYLRPFTRLAICALIKEPLLKALDLPQSPLLLKVFVHGALWMRAMAIRFLVPPRPEFLAVRRTPYGSDDGMSFCPAACTTQASGSLDVPDDSMARGGVADVLRKPYYHPFTDTAIGCMAYTDGYRIKDLGTRACPTGRFVSCPTYEGMGGGGSATEISKMTSVERTTSSKKDV